MNKNFPKHHKLKHQTTKEAILPPIDIVQIIIISLKIMMVALLVSLMTSCFIFIANTVTQSTIFAIKEISVSGTNILSKEEVIEQAEIYPDDNIFAINLRHTRLKVLSHPWIEDASVKRSLPSKITITVKEETPLAVVHIPDKADIILNRYGTPFTENDAIGSDIYINDIRNSTIIGTLENSKQDTTNSNSQDNNINTNDNSSTSDNSNITLPVVIGLRLSKQDGRYGFSGRLYDSVMKLLLMKKDGMIQKILADEESGVELEMVIDESVYPKTAINNYKEVLNTPEFDQVAFTFNQSVPLVSKPVRIKIGFDNYDEKFKIIRHIINYMQKNKLDKQVWSIDLINLENVVIKVKDITGNALPEVIHDDMPEHIEGGA